MGHAPLLAPSILSADQARLGEEIRAVEAAGADWIHVDVMDGHFVPNLTFGPPVLRALRQTTSLPLDVHLMIETPERSIDQYIDAGADVVTVHVEACVHLQRTLAHIRSRGKKVGVSLNPSTALSSLAYVLDLVDLVLIMTVNPGFGGQTFIEGMLPKITDVRAMADQQKLPLRISVDGGVDAARIPALVVAGADVFVAGSAVFGSKDYQATLASMRTAARLTRL